ncbi:winged helix-turn-helix domain-containing protein [Enterobacter cloacae]
MNYIINKTVLYSPELKKLSLLIDSESYIMLSNPAARLITEMMKYNKTTLTREHLLKHVWEDYGTTPSNNNLYMAVSEIRKAFKSLGMTEQLISTIPKTGFEFDAEIETPQQSGRISDQASPAESPPLIKTTNTNHKRSTFILVSLIAAIIVIILIISLKIITQYDSLPISIRKDRLTEDFTLAKCRFYNLGKESEDDKKWIRDMIGNELAKNALDIDCGKNESAVFYQKMPAPVNQIFIAHCAGNINSGVEACKSLRTDNE